MVGNSSRSIKDGSPSVASTAGLYCTGEDVIRVFVRQLSDEISNVSGRKLTLFKTEDDISNTYSSFFGNKSESMFLIGPDDLSNASPKFNSPIIHIGMRDEEFCLVVFQHQRMTLFLLIDPAHSSDLEFYRELNSVLTVETANLAGLVAENIVKPGILDDAYRYIYYNQLNLAIKTSINKKKIPASVRESLTVISNLHSDFEKNPDNIKEVYMRIRRDGWVVGKKFGNREFFIIFEQKNVSLSEINDEVHKVSSLFFASRSR